ncbi:MAG: endonuclease/exonuclease/phosphatase family protein [Planctomycetes bacterium]|nr:endonuclease/exonuclease/phosphatase family protein [Planctomycetota bacterium]
MRILTQNAYWLQGSAFTGTNPGLPDRRILHELAGFLKRIEPDVICLQEIQSAEAMKVAAEEFPQHPHTHYSPGAHYPQYGTAVMSKHRMRVLAHTPDLAARPQRAFQVVDVQGVTIANIHLPSGRQVGAEEAASLRTEELKNIFTTSDNVSIGAGDMNEKPGGPVGNFWVERGFRDSAEVFGMGAIATGAEGTGRGDYIFVHERLLGSLRHYCVAEAGDFTVDDGRYLSDHLPVWIDLDI